MVWLAGPDSWPKPGPVSDLSNHARIDHKQLWRPPVAKRLPSGGGPFRCHTRPCWGDGNTWNSNYVRQVHLTELCGAPLYTGTCMVYVTLVEQHAPHIF